MSEINQIFNVRIGLKAGGFNTFLYRRREAAAAAFDLLDKGMRSAFGGADPFVRLADDYGYETTQDMRDVGRIFSVGLIDAQNVQNELTLSAQKGQMRLHALIEGDPMLLAFLKRMSGRGGIIAPPSGMAGPGPGEMN